MSSEDKVFKQGQEVLSALDRVLAVGPWQQSVLLSNIGDELQQLREEFAMKLHGAEEEQSVAVTASSVVAEQVTVYVSLYCAEGHQLKRWLPLLKSVANQVVTRPVYRSEEDVRSLIRSKTNQQNEAYIALKVAQQDMLAPANHPVDRLGHGLLQVKASAVKVENIVGFVHLSGYYRVENGDLIRAGDVNFLENVTKK